MTTGYDSPSPRNAYLSVIGKGFLSRVSGCSSDGIGLIALGVRGVKSEGPMTYMHDRITPFPSTRCILKPYTLRLQLVIRLFPHKSPFNWILHKLKIDMLLDDRLNEIYLLNMVYLKQLFTHSNNISL